MGSRRAIQRGGNRKSGTTLLQYKQRVASAVVSLLPLRDRDRLVREPGCGRTECEETSKPTHFVSRPLSQTACCTSVIIATFASSAHFSQLSLPFPPLSCLPTPSSQVRFRGVPAKSAGPSRSRNETVTRSTCERPCEPLFPPACSTTVYFPLPFAQSTLPHRVRRSALPSDLICLVPTLQTPVPQTFFASSPPFRSSSRRAAKSAHQTVHLSEARDESAPSIPYRVSFASLTPESAATQRPKPAAPAISPVLSCSAACRAFLLP